MLDTKVPHGLSGLSLLVTIKRLLENTPVVSRVATLEVILCWLQQMKSLTTSSETGFLGLVRPWLLLQAVERSFKVQIEYLLPPSSKHGYKPSLAKALEIAYKTTRAYELVKLLEIRITDEERPYWKLIEIRPRRETDEGLIVLGGLISTFADVVASRTLELERSFQDLATEEQVLQFLSVMFKREIVGYVYTSFSTVVALEADGRRHQIEGTDDDIPF